MMNADLACRELVEIVTDYLEGMLPEPDRTRFEAHLATCRGCTNYLDQLRRMLRIMGRLHVDSLSPSARQDLLEAFRDWRIA
jgi:anti-sigma factor RsiW